MGELLQIYPHIPVYCGYISVDKQSVKNLSTFPPKLSTGTRERKNPQISDASHVFHRMQSSTTITKYTIHSYKKIYRIRSMYQTSDIEPDRYTTHPYIHHYP